MTTNIWVVDRNREHLKGVYKTIEVWPAAGCDKTEGSYSASLILKFLSIYNKLEMFKALSAKRSTTVWRSSK